MLVVVDLRKAITVQSTGPGEAKASENGQATGTDRFAQATTGSDGNRDLGCAHGHVGSAEEEVQLGTASVLDERREGLQGEVCVRLQFMAHQIWHGRFVVADALAQFDANGLALSVDDDFWTSGQCCDCAKDGGEDEERRARMHLNKGFVVDVQL